MKQLLVEVREEREREEGVKVGGCYCFLSKVFDLYYRVRCIRVDMSVPIAQIQNTTWTKDVYEPSDVSARRKRCDQSHAGIPTVTRHHSTLAG
jgi:hypothetical protein